jgi:hypothetical protein
MIYVGVDLHQRLCYTTALEARGKILQAGAVSNEKLALRRYFRQFRGKEVRGGGVRLLAGVSRGGGTGSGAFGTGASAAGEGDCLGQAEEATRCSPAARRYYERLLRKKHKHLARVALARKLLIAVYALLHDGVVFDEEKFAAM